jgi:competence protein ComFC
VPGLSARFPAATTWANALLGLLYPEVCQLCGENRGTPAEGFVCRQCAEKVRWIEPPFCARCGLPYEGQIGGAFQCGNCRELDLAFDWARAAVFTREPVLEVIHRYKYQRALWFEPFLAGLLIARAGPELRPEDWDCIVPVPLYPTREREREFNQAERLARRLESMVGIPVETNILRRLRPTVTQTQLSREERQENVRKAFGLRNRQDLSGKRFLLLDDVMTTGATTSACARVLKQAGGARVCVWTVARGL